MPTKNVVKVLSAKGDIAPDLESLLDSYVESRPLLIHRWFQEHGWPDENDLVGFAPIVELAGRVERQATELTRQFARYMVKFGEPEWTTASVEDYKARAAEIFRRAHVEE